MDRREWLARTSLTAATLGVPGERLARWVPSPGRPRPYLDHALDVARWIDASTETVDAGLRWPADPLKPGTAGLDFYNGMPGVVLFFAALHTTTRNRHWLDLGRAGADYLIAAVERDRGSIDHGLYTGLGGIGYTLWSVADAGGGARYETAARRMAQWIADDGVSAESNDIISGMAGTGLFLLAAARRWKDRALVEQAIRTGDRLLATAETAEGGLMWYPGASLHRNYPNFSHGTAGVAYFLATLHQDTGEARFLDGAMRGAQYLGAVATRRNGATTIFHQSGGGENRFYLSWCHGPVGTARLFYRLHRITGDQQWSDWVDALSRGVFESGAPEQRSAGYWNNISQCCGNVGIGQYTIDLARYHRTPAAADLQRRVVADTMGRATTDQAGTRWVQAENRTEPQNLVAQTGFMQGAAGVGIFLLQLDGFASGRPWAYPQPDTPFVG